MTGNKINSILVFIIRNISGFPSNVMHMYNFVLALCIQQMTSIMEWIFFYGVVIIFIVQVKSLPHGVCNELQRYVFFITTVTTK